MPLSHVAWVATRKGRHMDQLYSALVFPLLLLVGQALVALGQRKLNQRMDEGQAKTDAKRKAEAEWRDSIDKRPTSGRTYTYTLIKWT